MTKREKLIMNVAIEIDRLLTDGIEIHPNSPIHEKLNQALRQPLVVGSACDSEHHAFRLKWVGICYSCGQKEDVKQTDLKCATNKD